MGFTEAMPAGNQRNNLFVIHCHVTKRDPNIFRCRDRVVIAAWPFRIHVDQAHLNRGERVFQLSVATIALVVCEHLAFRAPIDQIRFPVVLTAAGKTEGLKAHGFHRDIARKHD